MGPARQTLLLPPATGSDNLRHAVGEPSALVAERSSFPGFSRISWDTQITCYSALIPLPASMADGEANGANTRHYTRIERKPKDA